MTSYRMNIWAHAVRQELLVLELAKITETVRL
jgi:hypothetical protein